MALFNLTPKIRSRVEEQKLLKKVKTPVKKKSSGHNLIIDTIENIRKNVQNQYADYIDNFRIIIDEKELNDYIERANKDGFIAIDTETTGLSFLKNNIVGICLYSPSQNACYVPINHVDFITEERYSNQLMPKVIYSALKKLTAKVIMFNAHFDIKFIKQHIGIKLICFWDCYIAARILNENEPSTKLKSLYDKYVNQNKDDKSVSFNNLFSGIKFDKVPINLAYPYAANDSLITFELFKFQSKYLNSSHTRQDLKDLYNLFMNIEMPCVNVVVDMELAGIKLDLDYIENELKPKYNAILEEKAEKCYNIINKSIDVINTYNKEIELKKLNSDNAKKIPNRLPDKLNLNSTQQIAVFLYDILKLKSPDPKNPRGTGEDILKFYNNEFTKSLLEYRSAMKMLSTYINKMPKEAYKGRIHCKFNQCGADTGRFSSSDPNMQNIPAKNAEIRKMFVADTKLIDREIEENELVIFEKTEEIETANGWKFVELLKKGDFIKQKDDKSIEVLEIEVENGLFGSVKVKFSKERCLKC